MIYLIGNCQMKVLAEYLRELPGMTEEVHNWYIEDPLSLLDLRLVRKSTVIYQNISAEAIRKHHDLSLEEAANWSTTGLGITGIKFPSIYHSGYFPDFIQDSRIQSIPGYSVPLQIVNRLKYGLFPDEIYTEMMDNNLYSAEYIREHWAACSTELRNRNSVDIQLVDYMDQEYSTRLMHTVNHPTKYLFNLITNLVAEKLKLPADQTILSRKDKMVKHGKLPIFPSIANALNMELDPIVVFKMKEMSVQDYLNRILDIFRTELNLPG